MAGGELPDGGDVGVGATNASLAAVRFPGCSAPEAGVLLEPPAEIRAFLLPPPVPRLAGRFGRSSGLAMLFLLILRAFYFSWKIVCAS